MKLTTAQREVLNNVVKECGGYACTDNYRPALKLVELGLCESRQVSFGQIKLVATDKGVALITGN
jgi:hypothetical protein